MDIYLPYEWAEIICGMEQVCMSEGIGPDSGPILCYIKEHYPELVEEYSHFYWEEI